MRIAMTEQFLAALAALDGADTKRAAAFLDRLVRDPAGAPANAEIVHDAGDRAVRSMRVTRDIRAIVCLEDDRVVLLFIAHHDAAYEWARQHCVRCRPLDGALEVVVVETTELAVTPQAARADRVTCIVEDSGSLCELLDSRGVAHDLAG